MSATRRVRFNRIALGLLFALSLKGNDITINVTGDPGPPWGAVRGDIFNVGFGDHVQFTSSDPYSGPAYTVVPTGIFFNVTGWTNVYTLLGRDLNPIQGAYLAITMPQDGDVHYSYTLDPSETWNSAVNTFSNFSPGTWTTVANALFPPPPPPPPPAPVVLQPAPVFLPPPVIVTPNLGINAGPVLLGPIDNPEPASGLLLISGVAAFWLWRRHRRQTI